MENIKRSARGWAAGLILICASMLTFSSKAQYSLPESTVDFTLYWNEVSNSDVVLSDVPAGHDVANETYLGWCVELGIDVELEVLLEGRLFNLADAPADLQHIDWNRVLYILNHKQGGRGDVQNAIWFFTDENQDLSGHAMAMVQAAIDHGENYVPAPGEVGAVLLLPANANIQVMIFEVPVPEHDGGGGPGGGGPGGGGEECVPPPRTIGYWKNHMLHLDAVLKLGSINVGDFEVSTPWQAVGILRNSSAHDARGSLRAQLLAAMLNLQNGSAPEACGVNIEDTIAEAVDLLDAIRTPILGGHPERARALSLKDLLDCYNNSGHGLPDCEQNDNGGGDNGGGDNGGGDNGGGDNDGGDNDGGDNDGGDNDGGDNGGGDNGGGPGGGDDECVPPPRTIGYWKNHMLHLDAVLKLGNVNVGDLVVATPSEAVGILGNSSASDARGSLRAQLLAAMLNLQNGSAPEACGVNIQNIVAEAVDLLDEIRTPILDGHPERARALSLKDLLDCFNNSGHGLPDCEQNDNGGGDNGGMPGGGDNGGENDDDGDQGANEKCNRDHPHDRSGKCLPSSGSARQTDDNESAGKGYENRGGRIKGHSAVEFSDYLKRMAEKYNRKR